MGDDMSKTKHGSKRGGDRKGGQIGYSLRFQSDQQKAELERLADEAGVSLNKFLVGLGEQALAKKHKRDTKTHAIEDLKQQRDAKWQKIVLHWEERGVAAARANKDKWDELGRDIWGRHFPKGAVVKFFVGSKDTDDPAPTSNTGKGRSQLEQEAKALLLHYASNHTSSSTSIRGFPVTTMDRLFEEYLSIEDEIADMHGLDRGGALGMALAETAWAAHRADRKRAEDVDDDEYDDEYDDDCVEDPDDDDGGDGPGDDSDSDAFMD